MSLYAGVQEVGGANSSQAEKPAQDECSNENVACTCQW